MPRRAWSFVSLLCGARVASSTGGGVSPYEANLPYAVDDTAGLGLRWEGVGAISGGGATSKLLRDYDPAVASDILDFLFTPGFGLSLQMLKVEIGGDTDATEGAEPSHMHHAGDEGYARGYEWWLMKEAKKRNPGIKLYGLPWGWPGWLDPRATADKPAKNAFADPALTANYTLAWLLGAKREHGLDIDYVGQWNERNAPAAYAAALRAAVANSSQAGTTTVLDRLPHYPGTTDVPDGRGCAQYAWNATDSWRRWVDEEGSIYDGRSARCLARCLNRGYISSCHTATIQWHLVSAFYDYLPWSRCGVAIANTPWSGAYEITSPTWALAHTSQFAPVGWRYAAHGSGVAMLAHGGSMVTRVSPDRADFSIVLEKVAGGASSACARGSNPASSPRAENVTLQFGGALLAALTGSGGGASKALAVWKSALASSNDEGANPPEDQVFQRLPAPLSVGADGTATLLVGVDELFTITTLTAGGKGAKAIAPAAPFPVPYAQPYDDESVGAPPRYWYTQMGAFEVQPSPDGDAARGHVMRQVSPVWPVEWQPSLEGPTSFFGPSDFGADLQVSLDVRLEDHGSLSLAFEGKGKAASDFQTATVNTDGSWSLGLLHRGSGLDFAPNTWHTLTVRNGADKQSLLFDGKLLKSLELLGRRRGASSALVCDNSTFPVDLSGKRYSDLTAGPAAATSADLCAQACCDAGPGCNIWQYSEHPAKAPNCWIGTGTSFTKAEGYTSRARTLPGWHLKATLSRYIYASFDNFTITKMS